MDITSRNPGLRQQRLRAAAGGRSADSNQVYLQSQRDIFLGTNASQYMRGGVNLSDLQALSDQGVYTSTLPVATAGVNTSTLSTSSGTGVNAMSASAPVTSVKMTESKLGRALNGSRGAAAGLAFKTEFFAPFEMNMTIPIGESFSWQVAEKKVVGKPDIVLVKDPVEELYEEISLPSPGVYSVVFEANVYTTSVATLSINGKIAHTAGVTVNRNLLGRFSPTSWIKPRKSAKLAFDYTFEISEPSVIKVVNNGRHKIRVKSHVQGALIPARISISKLS